jgi:hypothetical protein
VQVPNGAAPDGVEVSIAALEDGDLPAELQDVDAVGVGYELSPDGAEFTEPLAVTFRVDPDELDLDLPERAMPLGALLTTNTAGEFERIGGAVLSREDGMVVARGTMAHFTPAFLALPGGNSAVVLQPETVRLAIGATVRVVVLAANAGEGLVPVEEIPGFFVFDEEGSVVSPFSAMKLAVDDVSDATISCSASTHRAVVVDAYRVQITPTGLGTAGGFANVFI